MAVIAWRFTSSVLVNLFTNVDAKPAIIDDRTYRMQDKHISTLIEQVGVAGFRSKPRTVETVISRVFVFDTEQTVLKLYKRDNAWWNAQMQDLSGGAARIQFIRDDFAFNQALNPRTYLALQVASVQGGSVVLHDALGADSDELVIRMRKEDADTTLGDLLLAGSISLPEFEEMGRNFCALKGALPRSFLPPVESSWGDQMKKRLVDLKSWINSAPSFPRDVSTRGLEILESLIADHLNLLESMSREQLSVLMDVHSENMLYSDRRILPIDCYPPTNEWRIGDADVDVFRLGSDIYALSGEEAFYAYMRGVQSHTPVKHAELTPLYLLYGALIMGTYLSMLSDKDQKHAAKTEKYLEFIKTLLYPTEY